MNINLRLATVNDAQIIWDMQKIAFKNLLLKYQDFDTNPASEPLENVISRLNQKERYYYFIEVDDTVVGAINITDRKNGGNKRVSPMFILPQFQGLGNAQKAIREAERIHGEHFWELDTILQEEKLCYLYEKMGYKQTGKITPINEKMSLVFYQKA